MMDMDLISKIRNKLVAPVVVLDKLSKQEEVASEFIIMAKNELEKALQYIDQLSK